MKLDYIRFGSIVLNVVLLVLLLRQCGPEIPCLPDTIVQTKVDTIRVDEKKVTPLVKASKPKPIKVIPSGSGEAAKGFFVGEEEECAVIPFGTPSLSDTAIYADTLYQADAYRAILRDTVAGNRIVGRSLSYFNLTATIVKETTITKLQKEKVRLYAGAFASVSFSYLPPNAITNWSVGPALMLTIPQGLAVQYGFEARQNGHQATFMYKIKLKR